MQDVDVRDQDHCKLSDEDICVKYKVSCKGHVFDRHNCPEWNNVGKHIEFIFDGIVESLEHIAEALKKKKL